MKTLIKNLEVQIGKLEKLYDKKYKQYKKSIPFDKDFGDGILYDQAMKVSENKQKLKEALSLIVTANNNI